MKFWEYKTVELYSDEQLNKLGSAGWELVSVTLSQRSVSTAYFKRLK